MRQENSDRSKAVFNSKKSRWRENFDSTSFQWLEQNYIRIYGLRKWTWRAIMSGIIKEHINQVENESENSEIDAKYISLIWRSVFELAGI